MLWFGIRPAMPLYDLEMGAKLVDPTKFYKKYVALVAGQIPAKDFKRMCTTIETKLVGMKPSKKSQLVWTRLAALIGYNSDDPKASDHIWQSAFAAVKGHPKQCNLFVGALLMYHIARIDSDSWISQKTLDAGGVHPYRTYWINNTWNPRYTLADLKNKRW